jgi:hypothetical protein
LRNSYSYDEISTKILNASAPFISSPSNYICNKSIISETFPTCLKHSIIKPLFKKRNKENMTNYRLISASTDKASYRLNKEILNALNNKMMVGGIFCDLQKDFDCVNHNSLLRKLEFYGITGTSVKLIKFYLEGRHQRVILNNNSPDSCSN